MKQILSLLCFFGGLLRRRRRARGGACWWLGKGLAANSDFDLGVRVEVQLHAVDAVLQVLRRDDLRGRRRAHRLPVVTQAHLDAVWVRVRVNGEGNGGESSGGGEDSGGEGGGSEGCGGEGSGGDRDDGGVAPQCLPVRLLAFAGWDAHGGELPYRRLHTDVGIERPRAMRAWWGSRPGLRLGGGGGRSAPAVQPAGGPSVRQLDLPDRLSEGHGTDGERGQLLTGRAFESQQGEEHGPGGARDAHGSTEGRDDQAGAGPGQRARAGFGALRELALGSIEAGRLGLMRLFTGEHAAAGHAGAATVQEQVELEEDEAQAVQDGDGQQQQRGDGHGGGDEEHERDDLHWSEGAEERQHDIERARDERENLQVGEGGGYGAECRARRGGWGAMDWQRGRFQLGGR